jgi:F420-dependent methylenetetrahydromethanopterin dehydrogenase
MRNWKKLAMVMLMGLLVAGPIVPHHAFAQNMPSENAHTALAAAQAAQDKAAKDLHDAMTSMDSMKKMPMTANEKEMMKTIGQMADTIKNLMESNKQLIKAVEELRKAQPGSK